MEILKEKTKSICPICLQELDARVIENNNKVFLEKECPQYGRFEVLIEEDAELYKRLMNKEFRKERLPFRRLTLPITHKCNLNCQVCYAPDRGIKDFCIEELKAVIQDFKCEVIKLTGGEPTLYNNLPFLIDTIHENGKKCNLSTNGVKLIDMNLKKR